MAAKKATKKKATKRKATPQQRKKALAGLAQQLASGPPQSGPPPMLAPGPKMRPGRRPAGRY